MSGFAPDLPPKLGLHVVGLEIYDNGIKIGQITPFAAASIPDIQRAFSLINRQPDGQEKKTTDQETAA